MRKNITDAQVVQAADRLRKLGFNVGSVTGILAMRTKEPYKVCVAAMERAEERGLIKSYAAPWLTHPTKKGLELLNAEPGSAKVWLLTAFLMMSGTVAIIYGVGCWLGVWGP